MQGNGFFTVKSLVLCVVLPVEKINRQNFDLDERNWEMGYSCQNAIKLLPKIFGMFFTFHARK